MSLFTSAPNQPSYRDRLGYQSMLLAGICCLVATVILMGNLSTKPYIEAALEQDQLKMLNQVLPASYYDNNVLENIVTISDGDTSHRVYRAMKGGKYTGFAFDNAEPGYSGDIQIIMGVDASGSILGVRVVHHLETPGLGDKIELSKDDWILSFDGLSLENTAASQWAVKKDGGEFDQFTGATITPRAVVKAVHKGLQLYHNHQLQLHAPAENAQPEVSEHE